VQERIEPSAPDALAARDLYPRLLGAAWERLPVDVRAAFTPPPAGVVRRGRFAVRHGRSLLVRMALVVMRMPAAGDDVPLTLRVERDGRGGETWLRTFAGRLMPSQQHARADGLLVERIGSVECAMALEVDEGVLRFCARAATLRIGPLSIPLPRWMAPRIEAWSGAVGQGRVRTEVQIAMPLLGPVLAYHGELEALEVRGDAPAASAAGVTAATHTPG
jgi:hypothetical protein